MKNRLAQHTQKDNLKAIKTLNIVWTAYNEEFTIEASINSVKKSLKYAKNRLSKQYKIDLIPRGLICHNGCTDNTPEVVKRIANKSKGTFFEIKVIKSNKGMVCAQHKCIILLKKEGFVGNPILFIDADATCRENMIFLLMEQLLKHKKLLGVGAHPRPNSYKGLNFYKKILDKVLNFRAYFPKSEISYNYAPEFHPYATTDPQEIGEEFELKSKIYFHGRCFLLRNLHIWKVDKDSIAEDTSLDRYINKNYEPGSVRIMYNAEVNFEPLLSLIRYYKTYTRIYHSLEQLRKKHPEYENIREFSKTKLDYEYIKSLEFVNQANFYIYFIIRNTVKFLFKKNIFFIPKENLWKYNSKQFREKL